MTATATLRRCSAGEGEYYYFVPGHAWYGHVTRGLYDGEWRVAIRRMPDGLVPLLSGGARREALDGGSTIERGWTHVYLANARANVCERLEALTGVRFARW